MSLPRYPEYKDCGIGWLGPIPRHWQVRRLKFLFDLMRRPVRDDDEIVTAFRDGQVTLRTKRRRDGFTNALQEIGYQGVRDGDLVIHAMDAFAGAIGVSDSDGKSTPVYSVCSPRGDVADSHYYAPLLRHMALCGFINSLAKGIRERSTDFRWSDAGPLFLPLPPLLEQRSIIAFLDRETAKIDALIAEQEKLLALLAEKRQATISHAVTRGLDPNAPMKDSGIPWLGEVPAHWDVVRLKFLASVQAGIAKGKDTTGKNTISVPYLRVANVQDGHLALDEIAFIDIEPEQLNRYRLQPGDVLMNEGGDFDKLGRGAIWSGDVEGCIHQNHVFAVRPYGVSPQWLNQITGSAYAQFYFMGRSKQSTNLASISSTNIMELPVVLPPTEEQAVILWFIEDQGKTFDGLQAAARHATGILKERRSALIAAAVTGKIDVRSTVEAQAA